MNMKLRFSVFGFFLLSCNFINAQSLNNFSLKDIGQSVIVVTDGNGKTINMGVDMENYGSPFFENDFLPADVVLENGKTYQNIPVKINLLSNEIIFRTDDGKELAILPTVLSVKLKKNEEVFLFEYGYPSFEKQNKKTIYQVLAKGNISLLKYYFIQVTEAKPYSSATMLRTIEKFPKLFVHEKTIGIQKAPRATEEVESILKSNGSGLLKIIETQKLKIKKEQDLMKAILLYNQQ